jgi:hypothetical protein
MTTSDKIEFISSKIKRDISLTGEQIHKYVDFIYGDTKYRLALRVDEKGNIIQNRLKFANLYYKMEPNTGSRTSGYYISSDQALWNKLPSVIKELEKQEEEKKIMDKLTTKGKELGDLYKNL